MSPERHKSSIDPVIRRFIVEAGTATQALGFGRVVGQIYAYLYFSEEPKNLNELQDALGISKGSTSMGVRQLEQWDAVRRVWIKGDRKDYFEATFSFGSIIRKVFAEAFSAKMSTASDMIQRALEETQEGNGHSEFLRERIEHLDAFRGRAAKVWDNPILQRLLK